MTEVDRAVVLASEITKTCFRNGETGWSAFKAGQALWHLDDPGGNGVGVLRRQRVPAPETLETAAATKNNFSKYKRENF